MKLTNRDIELIQYINKCKGITIEQAMLLFFPSYNTAVRRLRILHEGGYLKCSIHPVLNKKVYYTKKLPSYHTIVINHICILLKDKIYKVEREFKISNFKVDMLLIMKSKNIIIIEVDIFNRTTKNKYNKIKEEFNKRNLNFEMIIVTKNKIKNQFCNQINIDEIEKLNNIIL